jgi:uncharacterized RDD family membrane protein YckC
MSITAPDVEANDSLVGHYAGAATRLAAFVIDAVLSVGAFEIGVAGFVWVLNLITRKDIHPAHGGPWWVIPLTTWLFLYFWYCYWLAGKTPGKALFGLRVVEGNGGHLGGSRAALRVVAFPLSWAFFGLGFIGIVFGRRRRALHDVIANTAVVYDYDARAARIRLLGRRTPVSRTTSEQPGETGAFTTAG